MEANTHSGFFCVGSGGTVSPDADGSATLPACRSVRQVDRHLWRIYHYESQRDTTSVPHSHRVEIERQLANLSYRECAATQRSIRHRRRREPRTDCSIACRRNFGSSVGCLCRALDYLGESSMECVSVVSRSQFAGSRTIHFRGKAGPFDFEFGDTQMNLPPNHALQRTRPSRCGCNRTPSRAGSLSLGR
jgi:hypothetical protein